MIGVMDAAELYLTDDGVIMRNEDPDEPLIDGETYADFGTHRPFARHQMDLWSGEVPHFGFMATVIGSNGVARGGHRIRRPGSQRAIRYARGNGRAGCRQQCNQ